MHATRRAAERDLIERVLQFASLEFPADAHQAAELLLPICTQAEGTPIAEMTRDHIYLNKWLAKITSRKIVAGERRFIWRADTLAEMLQMAERCVIEMHPRFERSSTLSYQFRIVAPSIESGYAYAVGLLIDPKKSWARLVRRCAWRDCGKFFVSRAIRGGGSGEHMCSDACRKAAKNWSSKKSRSS